MPANKKPSKRAAAKAALLASAPAAIVAPVAPAIAAPAKPDKAAERSARVALTVASHAFTSALYSGSQPVHSAKPGKLADYIARIQQPRHTAPNGTSERDHVLLRRIVAVLGPVSAGTAFDPSAPNLAADIGVISRLASVAYIVTDGSTVTFTKAGAERAMLVSKPAKAA